MAQARMLIDAKSAILKSGDFIPAGEVSKLAGYSRTNPSVQPNKWKRNRSIFAIEHKGDDFFPLYALDPDDNYRPRKAVSEILGIFGDSKDGWGLAFWFAGLNSFLDDERPQDLLAAAPEQVPPPPPEMRWRECSMAKSGSRFLPPSGILDATLVDWGSGRTMHRVHDAAYAANLFNPSPTGNARFSPIRDEAGAVNSDTLRSHDTSRGT